MVENAVLKSLTDKDSHQYWFVEHDGTIIGALGVNENTYKSGGYEMVEDYVAVHQRYRKQGIGSKLLFNNGGIRQIQKRKVYTY